MESVAIISMFSEFSPISRRRKTNQVINHCGCGCSVEICSMSFMERMCCACVSRALLRLPVLVVLLLLMRTMNRWTKIETKIVSLILIVSSGILQFDLFLAFRVGNVFFLLKFMFLPIAISGRSENILYWIFSRCRGWKFTIPHSMMDGASEKNQ